MCVYIHIYIYIYIYFSEREGGHRRLHPAEPVHVGRHVHDEGPDDDRIEEVEDDIVLVAMLLYIYIYTHIDIYVYIYIYYVYIYMYIYVEREREEKKLIHRSV